jgi:ribonuclease BN (tRNA processing enzyme)
MKLVLLGTTGYHPNERRHTPAMVLPEVGIVLDAGTAMFRLRSYVATDWLDIFLTHAHLDHVVGLTFLLGALADRKMQRITIHGEPAKLAAVRQHLYAELLFPVPPQEEFRPLAPEVPLVQGGRLTHFPLVHPGGTVGYRLDWPGRSLAYVTDTTADPAAPYVDLIRGVDVLVHECNFPDSQREFALVTGHSHTSAVAHVARQAGVGRLVLVHLDPESNERDPIGLDVARAIFPRTDLGEDLMEIEF